MQHEPRDPFPDSGGSTPRPPGSWTLRRKILVAFSCLAAIVGVSGAVGLIFFERIAASASNLSSVGAPLLTEGIALQRNVDRMRSILSENAAAPASGEPQLAALDSLAEEGGRHAGRLTQLAEAAGLPHRFDAVEQLQGEFTATLKLILQARGGLEQANADMLAVRDRFHAAASTLESGLSEIVQRRSGTSTSDRKAVQSLDEVIRKFTEARELVTRVLTAGALPDLQSQQAAIDRFLGSLPPAIAGLKAQIRQPDDILSLARLDAPLATLRATLAGQDGLIARKRDMLTATALLAERDRSLDEIEGRYNDVLADVADAVQQRNEQSVLQTAGIILNGRIAVFTLTAVAGLLAIAAAFFLTVSICGPLERLTRHLRGMRKGGDLAEITDSGLLSAGDELGALSRTFNIMIRELEDARRELIAKSEAEISKQIERMDVALANMSQGLVMYDQDQRLIISNARYAEIYGLSADQLRPGMTFAQILELRVTAGTYHGEPGTYVGRLTAGDRNGLASDTVVELQNGRIVQILRRPLKTGGWVATHEDITARRQIEAKIAHMAHHDVLTNLPNRILFGKRMEESLARTERGETIAVLCLDFDHFKTVNDTLGHSIGDALLRAATERLLGCVRETDTVARLGGDEFAVIQVALEGPHEAGALAERIVERMAAPFILDAHQVVIGTSVGIALAPNDGLAADDLLKKADLALYRAKSDGRSAYRFFEPDMDASMQARRRLELELRNALGAGQFELHYQPLVNLDTGQISSFEALLRWRHPERGDIAPSEFIPLAEEIGVIIPIGEWVIHQACRDAANWPSHIHIAVNLSPVQFKSRKLVETITLALTNSGLPATRLELEITESVLLNDSEVTLTTLRRIKALGVRISMDDFGTGYSSLSYLRSFPFDRIKIDRSFIRDIGESEDCVAIVRAVTSLGASLGMATIAEGVETAEQLEKLRKEGCTEVQGFYLGSPKSLAEIGPLLEDIRRSAAAA